MQQPTTPKGKPKGRPAWLEYITVPDLKAAVKAAKALGAKQAQKATPIPNVGQFAILKDPSGAVFAPFESLGAKS